MKAIGIVEAGVEADQIENAVRGQHVIYQSRCRFASSLGAEHCRSG